MAGPMPASAFRRPSLYRGVVIVPARRQGSGARSRRRELVAARLELIARRPTPLPDQYRESLAVRRQLMQRDDARCPLPYDVEPRRAGTRHARYQTAAVRWHLRARVLDLVQENVGWFGQRGSETLRIVVPRQRRASGRVSTTAAHVSEDSRPSRSPNLRSASATRGRSACSAPRVCAMRPGIWRRALDRVKFRRNRLVWTLTERVFEPVVPPLVNWWKGGRSRRKWRCTGCSAPKCSRS